MDSNENSASDDDFVSEVESEESDIDNSSESETEFDNAALNENELSFLTHCDNGSRIKKKNGKQKVDDIVLLKDKYSVVNLENVEFGVMSETFIKKLSVCNVTESKMTSENGVYDKRMGTMSREVPCVSCGLEMKKCPGHYGHIELAYPVINPIFYKTVLVFLRCFCKYCFRIRINDEHMRIIQKRMSSSQLIDYTRKRLYCQHCFLAQPKYSINVADGVVTATHLDSNKKTHKETISSEYIFTLFDHITDADIKLLKFNPKLMHPRDLVLNSLPVIPVRSRPFVVSEQGIFDDDLTIQYSEIIKINNKIQTMKSSTTPLYSNQNMTEEQIHYEREIRDMEKKDEEKMFKLVNMLKFRIKCLMDNSHGKSKHINNRALKGIKERMCGKSGVVRGNLMGKRCNQSCRTVIGPDPTLPLGWIGIPEGIANTLTEPCVVNDITRDILQKRIANNECNTIVRADTGDRINIRFATQKVQTALKVGDVIVKENSKVQIVDVHNANLLVLEQTDTLLRNGTPIEFLVTKTTPIVLANGDIVECRLRTGSYVALNRMPTLHAGSFMSHRVVIRNVKTIQMPLAVTGSYAADFDGDEMNAYAPITDAARAELEFSMGLTSNFMSAQSGSSNIRMVQDGVLGLYLMTNTHQTLEKGLFFQMCMRIINRQTQLYEELSIVSVLERMREVQVELREYYTTRVLVSMVMPNDFFYRQNGVVIEKGCLRSGTLTKKDIGGGHGSIVYLVAREYGERRALDMVNQFQWLVDIYLENYGFSIGFSDCFIDEESTASIQKEVEKGFVNANVYEKGTMHEGIKEARINNVLSQTKDIGMTLAKNLMLNQGSGINARNGFVDCIVSGSKGAYFNICQITSLLGQQIHHGGRIRPQLSGPTIGQKRTLPHYDSEESDLSTKYESRGFVRSSFFKGLTPKEFIFHTISSREGIINTALKTANSGYAQRKLVKYLEDACVHYDGTVRTKKSIIQIKYGNDGLDGRWNLHESQRSDPTNGAYNLNRIVERFS